MIEKNPLRFLPRLFNDSYILLLNTSNQIMNERLTEIMVQCGQRITPREKWILRAADEKPLSQGAIAHALNINLNVMVRHVDVLEKKGLVKRKDNKKSRRAYVIAVTPKGRALLRRCQEFGEGIAKQVVQPRSLDDLKWAATMARDIINDYYSKNKRGPKRRLASSVLRRRANG